MAIYNTDIPSSNSITFLPPAPVNEDQRDIRSSMIAGSQYKHDENLTKWQQWAQKALHVSGDPFLILVFHDKFQFCQVCINKPLKNYFFFLDQINPVDL